MMHKEDRLLLKCILAKSSKYFCELPHIKRSDARFRVCQYDLHIELQNPHRFSLTGDALA